MRWAFAVFLQLFAVAAMAQPQEYNLNREIGQIEIVLEGQGEILRISVLEICNPSRSPFGIILSDPNGEEITRIAIFPADRTGDYLVPARAIDGVVKLSIDFFRTPADIEILFTARKE